jgi:glyoxylase-like metal-dependent hydrolase (beta-lactamase superfamily II)
MFVARADGQVIADGRVAKLAADEAAQGTPPGCYLSWPEWRLTPTPGHSPGPPVTADR